MSIADFNIEEESAKMRALYGENRRITEEMRISVRKYGWTGHLL